jgi:hypothetical protein
MTQAARSLADRQYDRRCFPYRCVRHTFTVRLILHPSTHLALSVSGGSAEPGSALPQVLLFKANKQKSSFAQHLMHYRHAIGPTQDIMDVVHITKKGRMMDTLEKNFTYSEKQN